MNRMDEIKEVLEFWETKTEPMEIDELVIFYCGAKAVHRKIKDFNLQIEVPSYCYEIIGLASRYSFAFGILMFVDILEYLSKDKKIPKGYEITCEDFKNTFKDGVPYLDDQEWNRKYHEKWLKQKDYELSKTDNQVDYLEFWEDYFE